MSPDSKPGAATPYSLYKMYKSQGAVMANPCTLRQQFGLPAARTVAIMPSGVPALAQQAREQAQRSMQLGLQSLGRAAPARTDSGGSRWRSDSPPRMQFKVIQARGLDPSATTSSLSSVSLSLASLNMNRTQ